MYSAFEMIRTLLILFSISSKKIFSADKHKSWFGNGKNNCLKTSLSVHSILLNIDHFYGIISYDTFIITIKNKNQNIHLQQA